MSIDIIPYTDARECEWEQFCADAVNSTFLHTRKFLSYHGERFKDLSVLIVDSGKLVGIFPAAACNIDAALVISHPGITYGGIVHQGRLIGNRMVEAISALSEYYFHAGFSRLQYKAVPYIYSTVPSQDDLYALFRLGARRVRCDLSSSIRIANRLPASDRRRRGLKKAKKNVTLSSDPRLLPDLWGVIAQNLALKHDASPVHTLGELALLQQRFPENILIRCALLEGQTVAGIVFFNSSVVWHAQYIGASESAYNLSALDAVFDSAIAEAKKTEVRYFDFGTSNENGGLILNEDRKSVV